MPGDTQTHRIAAIRKLLLSAFTAQDLRRFCQDREPFQPILIKFAPNPSLADMVDEVISYCETRDLWSELLSEVARENPRQYQRFKRSLSVVEQVRYPEAPPGQPRRPPVWLWPVVGAAAALAAFIIVFVIAVGGWDRNGMPSPEPGATTPVACDEERATFDFESKSNEGWDIRWEGVDRLGESVMPDDGHYCGSGHWSLAFDFQLRTTPPFDKAQVKYETEHLSVAQELSAWIYAPANAPGDLQASCFVLEDNTAGTWSGKPEWPWYQTGYTPLEPDEWTLVRCLPSDFVSNYAGGHYEAPLLLGFELTRAGKGVYEGTVYLDKVVLR